MTDQHYRIHSFFKFVTLLSGVILTCLSVSGCIQGKTYASTQFSDNAVTPISEDVLRSVNANFRTTFVGGDWYYEGAKQVKGEIYAYIQIPQRMQLNKAQQEHYLKKAICPGENHKALWDNLQDIPLSVHVYTLNKRHTVYANCSNPFA